MKEVIEDIKGMLDGGVLQQCVKLESDLDSLYRSTD